MLVAYIFMRDIGISSNEIYIPSNPTITITTIHRKDPKMNPLTVYYNAEGMVLLELESSALELTRAEAEQLFVDLGHVLQDMDIERYDEDGMEEECPTS